MNVRLPITERDPLARFREIRRRVEECQHDPAVEALPALAEAVAVLPRSLYPALAHAGSQSINLIVTNVPGIMRPATWRERTSRPAIRSRRWRPAAP